MADKLVGPYICKTPGSIRTADVFKDNSCVAFYPLDNSALDQIGNYNGVWYGTETYTRGINCSSKAAYFNGSSHISLGTANTIIPTGSQFAISFWVKIDQLLATNDRVLGSEYFNGGFTVLYRSLTSTFHFLLGDGNDSNNNSFLNLNTTLMDKTHVVIMWDGSNMGAYVNGVSQGTLAKTQWSYSNNGVNFQLGADADASTNASSRELPIDGYLDQVRIFNKALTAQEVQTLYNEG